MCDKQETNLEEGLLLMSSDNSGCRRLRLDGQGSGRLTSRIGLRTSFGPLGPGSDGPRFEPVHLSGYVDGWGKEWHPHILDQRLVQDLLWAQVSCPAGLDRARLDMKAFDKQADASSLLYAEEVDEALLGAFRIGTSGT